MSKAVPGERMSATELRAGASLAAILGLRMLGLFLILPVFAVHAPQLAGGDNLTLVGAALGAYGLAQALLQIPYGMASDRWGRKPLLVGGLLVFAAGSFLAATADDIWTAIAGRAMQGAGAISSVAMAFVADFTREQHRTKAMAMIGATIGSAFAFSLVLAPALYGWIGLSGLFALTGGLAIAAVGVVLGLVPAAPQAQAARGATTPHAGRVIGPDLMRLNAGIFSLHAIQMAMFVVLPPQLVRAGLAVDAHWKVYLPALLISFVVMVPPILFADRSNRPRPVLLGAVCLLVVGEAALAFAGASLAVLATLLCVFFAAFNVLEALLPSLVSRVAPPRARGKAIGVYNTSQTLGLFCGGLLGGLLARHVGPQAVYLACAALGGAWLLVAAGMRTPPRRAVNGNRDLTFSIAAGVDMEGLRDALAGVRGVLEAQVLASERLARLRVVPGEWDEHRVRELVTGQVDSAGGVARMVE